MITDLICPFFLATIYIQMIWQIEISRRTSQPTTQRAKVIALLCGASWVLFFLLTQEGLLTGEIQFRHSLFMSFLLFIPAFGYLRLAISLQLDKNGVLTKPNVTEIRQWGKAQGVDEWLVIYQYEGEYQGKRKIFPTEKILLAQSALARKNEQKGNIDEVLAAAFPDAVVRYLPRRPNIHRFSYDEPDKKMAWK